MCVYIMYIYCCVYIMYVCLYHVSIISILIHKNKHQIVILNSAINEYSP